MKSLLILLLALALVAALFLTRPSKADFEKYVHDDPKIVEGGGKSSAQTLAETIGDKFKTFANTPAKSPVEAYLEQCTYENRLIWINVKHNGQLVYTGAVGKWWKRG